jgi:hypothetical protein
VAHEKASNDSIRTLIMQAAILAPLRSYGQVAVERRRYLHLRLIRSFDNGIDSSPTHFLWFHSFQLEMRMCGRGYRDGIALVHSRSKAPRPDTLDSLFVKAVAEAVLNPQIARDSILPDGHQQLDRSLDSGCARFGGVFWRLRRDQPRNGNTAANAVHSFRKERRHTPF